MEANPRDVGRSRKSAFNRPPLAAVDREAEIARHIVPYASGIGSESTCERRHGGEDLVVDL